MPVGSGGASLDAREPELMRAIDQAMQVGVVAIDPLGRIVHVNAAMCRLVGWSAEELLGQTPPFAYWPASDVPEIQAAFDEALQGRDPPEGTIVTLRHRSGRLFPARIQVGPLSGDVPITGWVATISDVSASQATLAALAESERRFQQLAGHIHEVFYIWDPEQHRVTYVSPSYERVFGRPAAPLLDNASSFRSLVEPGYHPVIDQARLRQAQGLKTSVEYPVMRPDGSLRWIWDQSFPVQEGEKLWVVGIAADITRRRQAEETMHRQLHLLTQAEQIAGLGSCVLDLNVGAVAWSDGFRELLRLPKASPSGIRLPLRRLARGDRATVISALRRLAEEVMAGRGQAPISLMVRLPGGQWPERLLRMRAGRHEPGLDGGFRLVVTLQDVTDQERMSADLDRYREHLEELVVQRTRELADATRKADAASRAKSEFLANISHEIRTPMNAIIGLVHLLHENTFDPQLREGIRGIEVSAHQLLALVNDVLDLSKVEAGRLSLEQSDFDVRQLIADVLAVCRESAAAKGLRMKAWVGDGVPNRLRGDRLRISQVLLNLVSNAVKFTHEGRVDLRVDLAPTPDGPCNIRFEVSDTGIGIATEDLPRLFEPFEQVGRRTAAQSAGTGLGLSISQRLVQLMGGRLQVRSRLGSGSVFSFDVPLPEVASPPASTRALPHVVSSDQQRDEAKATLESRQQGQVLVVDDNRLNRRVTCEILRREGYVVDTAASGDEAISRAARTAYDTILMDLRMPGIDGLTAARVIRQLPGNADPAIIAMSGTAPSTLGEEWRDSGMDEFVTKPVRPRTLLSAVAHGVDLAGRRRSAARS